ncbi:MAG: molybdenum cofactor biosynthesis protein MoaE [Sphingomicrobium sp.]
MSVVALLVEAGLDPRAELGALLEQSAGAGALVSFVGIARPAGRAGEPVTELVLDHHPTLTRQSLEAIAVAAAERFAVSHVRVVHRCGRIAAGAPILFAGASSAHRRAAFDCADFLMDRLKTEAILWKREVGDQGSAWIEPSDADHADNTRWG